MEKDVKNGLNSHSKTILNELKDEFDTHDFINEFIRQEEKEYIELLYQYKSFRKLNSQIGRYLEANKEDLRIEKNDGK